MRWLAVPAMASALTLGCSDKEDGEARSASRDQIDAGVPGDPSDGGTTPGQDGGPCHTTDAGPYDPFDGGPFDPTDAGPYDPSDAGPYPYPDAGPYDPSDAGPFDPDGGHLDGTGRGVD